MRSARLAHGLGRAGRQCVDRCPRVLLRATGEERRLRPGMVRSWPIPRCAAVRRCSGTFWHLMLISALPPSLEQHPFKPPQLTSLTSFRTISRLQATLLAAKPNLCDPNRKRNSIFFFLAAKRLVTVNVVSRCDNQDSCDICS